MPVSEIKRGQLPGVFSGYQRFMVKVWPIVVGGGEAAINNFEMTPKGAHDRGAERDLKKERKKEIFPSSLVFSRRY